MVIGTWNSGMGPHRLQYKLKFYDALLVHVDAQVAAGRTVIIAGDLSAKRGQLSGTDSAVSSPPAREDPWPPWAGPARVAASWWPGATWKPRSPFSARGAGRGFQH